MFLSADEIIEAVKSNVIRIKYDTVKINGKIIFNPDGRYLKISSDSTADEFDKASQEFFYDSLEPDSLRCHLGPYALIEETRGSIGKENIERKAGEIRLNIEKAKHLLMYAGQFFLVGTNEFIDIENNIGGTVLPNVRNTDVGISPVTGCLDPGWEGILQLGIINLTKSTKQLYHLDPICILRFHRLSKIPSDDTIERFRRRRPHYKNSWERIRQEPDGKMFPRRKEYDYEGKFWFFIKKEKYAKRLFSILSGLLASGVLLSFLTIIYKVGQFSNDIDAVKSQKTEIEKLNHEFTSFKNSQNKSKTPLIFNIDGEINKFHPTIEHVFDLKDCITIAPATFVQFANSQKFNYKISFDNEPGCRDINAIKITIESLEPVNKTTKYHGTVLILL